MTKMLDSYSYSDYKKPNLMFVPSFQFTTSLTKEKADEFIYVIMAKTGVQVFGYKRRDDEYWGKIKINKNENVKFTLSFKKTLHNKTIVTISSYNITVKESEQLSLKIYETINLFEISQSIYKNKHYL